jgi:hypothetical protein
MQANQKGRDARRGGDYSPEADKKVEEINKELNDKVLAALALARQQGRGL